MVTGLLMVELTLVKCHRKFVVYPGQISIIQPQLSVGIEQKLTFIKKMINTVLPDVDNYDAITEEARKRERER